MFDGLLEVSLPDASVSPVRVYDGTGEGTRDAGALSGDSPLIVVWPGWGMGARYYEPIARELDERGYPVAIGELRGHGGNTAVATRKHRWGYHDMASQDYPLTIAAVKRHLGLPEDHPTVLLCHSMGGQIGALFLAREESRRLGVVGLVGVGAGTPYYRGFDRKNAVRLFAGAYIMRAIATLYGYQPAGILDVSGYGRQSADHVVEWTHYVHRNYLSRLARADMDYRTALTRVTVPVWLARCVNDSDCPMASAASLAASMPQTPSRLVEVPEPLGHNRWAREPKAIADVVEEFLSAL